ncbi:hypothetical protein ACS0TY_015931 [Phlomoides rotata]
MEGLIPLVYKAIVQYRNGGGTWVHESPSASYMRLPGDSGRFSTSDIQLFRPYFGFSACSPPHSAAERVVSTATGQVQHRLNINSCRAIK